MRIRVSKEHVWPDTKTWYKLLNTSTLIRFGSPYTPQIHIGTAVCKQCGTERFGTWNALKHWSPLSKPCPEVESDNEKLSNESSVLRDACKTGYREFVHAPCPVCGSKHAYIWAERGSGSEGNHWADNDTIEPDDDDRFWWYDYDYDDVCTGFYNGNELHRSTRQSTEADKAIREAEQETQKIIEERFLLFKDFKHKINRRPAQKCLNDFVKACNLPAALSAPVNIASIKNDPENLKNYIFNLLQLENNILSISKRLTTLYELRIDNNTAVVGSDFYSAYSLKETLSEAEQYYHSCIDRLNEAKNACPEPVEIMFPAEPAEPLYRKPGLFNKKKVLAMNEELEKQYRLCLEQYEKDCEEQRQIKTALENENQRKYEESIHFAEDQVANAKIPMEQAKSNYEFSLANPNENTPERAIQRMITQEIETAENALQKTYAARNELYAANIVFGKYQDLVSLSTFYEYLMAGRCTTLEGTDGAYNLYESEIRSNLIISKLSEISASLEKIQKNQYMVYSQLTSMNSKLSSIDNSMKNACTALYDIREDTQKIAENTSVIAYNTEVAAFYSKANTELTNALGYMVAFK